MIFAQTKHSRGIIKLQIIFMMSLYLSEPWKWYCSCVGCQWRDRKLI